MKFDNSKPIYIQIMDEIKKQIIRGELRPGEKILSQREYAEKANVNPNTVQRAYKEMENLNLVETIRGQGTFISNRTEMLEQIKEEMASKILNNFIKEMYSLGLKDRDIRQQVNNYLQNVNKEDLS